MKNPVVYWEINGTEGRKLADFYLGLFEWEFHNEPGSDFYHFKSGNDEQGSINGGVFTGKGKLPHHITIYIKVDDVDTYYKKALETGGTHAQAPFDIGNQRVGFFRDPDGHIIGLVQDKDPG